MESNTKKKPLTNPQNQYKNAAKRLRAITKWGAIEKSPVFIRVSKLYSGKNIFIAEYDIHS